MPEWCAPGARRGCDRLWRWGTHLWSVPEVVVCRGCHDWAELEKPAEKMIESGQEFADSVESAEDIDRFQTSNTGARRAIALTFSTPPVPVEPVSERIAAGCLERAGAARHRERHFGLHALGFAVRRDTQFCGAQGTAALAFECGGCVLADDSLARVSGLTIFDSASSQIAARVDNDGIGEPRISSTVVMSLRPLFWALRHLVIYRGDIQFMGLFLIT